MFPWTGIIPCPLGRCGEQKIFVTVVNCLMRLMGRCDEILRVEQNVCPFQKISLPNRVQMVNDDPTKYQDLRVGRIDAILVDRLAALDLVKKTNDTLAVTGEAFSRQESGVALRKGNEDLLKAVNDAIAEMQKDGTLQALSEKWFGADVTK